MSKPRMLLLETTDGRAVAPCSPPLTERPTTAEAADAAARGLPTSERRGTRVYHRVRPSVLAATGTLPTLPAVA